MEVEEMERKFTLFLFIVNEDKTIPNSLSSSRSSVDSIKPILVHHPSKDSTTHHHHHVHVEDDNSGGQNSTPEELGSFKRVKTTESIRRNHYYF